MLTVDTLVSAWPGWIAFFIGIILAFNKLAEESEKFANRFGRYGRKIRDRALRRHGFDAAAAIIANAVQEAVNKAVAEAREKWEEEENEALAALDRRLSSVSATAAAQALDLETMRFAYNCCLAYADYEASWHNRLSVKVATRGNVTLDQLPNHYSYYDFEKQYKKNSQWRKWAFQHD